jgi:hypothetical protein
MRIEENMLNEFKENKEAEKKILKKTLSYQFNELRESIVVFYDSIIDLFEKIIKNTLK